MLPIEINYLAVVVSAVVAFGTGALWYSPILFGNAWIKAHGFSDAQVQQMQSEATPMPYIGSALSYVVMAVVISIFISYSNASTLMDGLWLGLLFWLGFAAPIGLTGNLFSEKKRSVFVIDTFHQLTYLLLASVILTIWR